MIRHIVQTSPLWIAIVLAARNSALTKWAALPCFVFWLATEIVMTIIVGSASAAGIVDSAASKAPRVRAIAAIATSSLVLVVHD